MYMKVFKFFLVILCINTMLYRCAIAQDDTPEMSAKAYVLLEPYTGRFLLEHNAHTPLPPASLTKVMTAYVVFDAIKKGEITLETTTTVSALARRQDGSRTYLELNDTVTIDTLLRGLLAHSGNDAAVALAEAVSGSVEAFVVRMNETAQMLNMKNTHWMNPNGLPKDGHVTSAYDLGLLSRAIITEYHEYYEYFGLRFFKYAGINQRNRNRLLFRENTLVDGMKTGWTVKAGYCVINSKEIDGMRLVAVILGAKTPESRFTDSETVFKYGFETFKVIKAFDKTQLSFQAPVKTSEVDWVTVKPDQEAPVLLMKKSEAVAVVYQPDVPIIEVHKILPKHTQLGVVRIFLNNQLMDTYPLFTTAALKPISKWQRFVKMLGFVLH